MDEGLLRGQQRLFESKSDRGQKVGPFICICVYIYSSGCGRLDKLLLSPQGERSKVNAVKGEVKRYVIIADHGHQGILNSLKNQLPCPITAKGQ